MARVIPLFTLEGVPDAEMSTHPFSTEDKLGLSLLRFRSAPCEDAVLIIHGQTASSDMFIMPEHENLVRFLLDHGFTDIWTVDSRMSNRYPYNLPPHSYCLDDVALYDFPAALAAVRAEIGDRPIHVICHCLGSVAFMMSLFGKAIDGVASVISNAAALTPAVRRWSRVKAFAGPFLVESVFRFPYASPNWHQDPGFSLGKAFAKAVSLFHRECDVPACHMLSFMWGAGWPAMYLHENLDAVTHERIGDLLGPTTLNYHRHALKMVRAGCRAVKMNPSNPRYAALPDDYLEYAAEIETPILFVTGEQNRVFTDSNVRCFHLLEMLRPGRQELQVFPGYGHADIFMGKRSHIDVFPRFLAFLESQRERTRAREGARPGGDVEVFNKEREQPAVAQQGRP